MSFKQTLAGLRRSKNARLIVILILFLILAAFYVMFEKFRIWIAGIMVILLVALGLEVADYDIDLSTGERILQSEDGSGWLIENENCQKDRTNCDNFDFQEEAQELFDTCGGKINDIYGLDRDKDGIVCEALPRQKKADSIL